ncbi:Auxin efflux carrier family protein [Entamoeba marina]
MDFGVIILSTFYAVFKLVVVAVAGFFATYTANFNKELRGGYSRLVFQYFVPATIFTQTATSVDRITDIVDWWWLLLSVLLINCLALLFTHAIAAIFRLETKLKRVFVFTIAFGNTMYIPLALVDSLTSETDIFKDGSKERGGAYICTFLLGATTFYWTYGYSYMQKNQDETIGENEEDMLVELSEENDDVPTQNDDIASLEKMNEIQTSPNAKEQSVDSLNSPNQKQSELDDSSQNDIKESTQKLEDSQTLINTSSTPLTDPLLINEESSNSSFKRFKDVSINALKKISIPFSFVWSKTPSPIKKIIKSLLTPPTIAVFTGLLFVLAYPVRDVFFDDGKLAIIGRSLKYLGTAAVISALFILGGNLSSGPRGGKIKWYIIFIGLFSRLVIIPSICISIHFLLWHFGIIPSDPMFFVVLCIESCTPPALNTAIIMSIVYPDGNEDCATILFWAYLFSLITLSGWLVVSMFLMQLN